jgi:hypothetical protein
MSDSPSLLTYVRMSLDNGRSVRMWARRVPAGFLWSRLRCPCSRTARTVRARGRSAFWRMATGGSSVADHGHVDADAMSHLMLVSIYLSAFVHLSYVLNCSFMLTSCMRSSSIRYGGVKLPSSHRACSCSDDKHSKKAAMPCHGKNQISEICS